MHANRSDGAHVYFDKPGVRERKNRSARLRLPRHSEQKREIRRRDGKRKINRDDEQSKESTIKEI